MGFPENDERILPKTGQSRISPRRKEIMSKKILVSIDLSDHSISVIKKAQSIKDEGDELLLLHVILDPSEFAGFYVPHRSMELTREELFKDAKKKMERFTARYAPGTSYMLEFGFPYRVILDVAEKEKIGLIVIGKCKGSGLLEHIFVRSTSKKVLRHAVCDVHVVPLPVGSEEAQLNKANV
jgi:nucleotide-binding universal stress UspA family protein